MKTMVKTTAAVLLTTVIAAYSVVCASAQTYVTLTVNDSAADMDVNVIPEMTSVSELADIPDMNTVVYTNANNIPDMPNTEISESAVAGAYTSVPLYIAGDLDGDHVLTSADALAVLAMSQTGYGTVVADIDLDGEVTSADAIEILFRSAE